MCWGMNKYGQLGIGKTVNMYRPIAVGPGTGMLSISRKSVFILFLSMM
jgi:hypothetical protein